MTWESTVTMKSETTPGTTPLGKLHQEYFEMKYAKLNFSLSKCHNYFTKLVFIGKSIDGRKWQGNVFEQFRKEF